MESKTDTFPALEQITRPAFTVEGTKITSANTAAQSRQLTVGTDIGDMLGSASEQYKAMTDGQLSFILQMCDISYDTTVIRRGQDTLFVLSTEYAQPELKALSLAAQILREPLSNAMINTDQVLPNATVQADPVLYKQLLQINRNLHQLQRAISNMADAGKYQQINAVAMELRDVTQIIAQTLEKASALLSDSKIKLSYTLPNEAIYSLVNEEMLERGLLNLISNAAKGCDAEPICVTVGKTDKNVCITVSNTCSGTTVTNLFNRYLRQPELEDGRNGIGLGLSLVRGAAYAHKGTVLTERFDNTLRVTMTLRIQCSNSTVLRTPIRLSFDYAGGRDHALIELSDILTEDVYKQ